MIATQAQIDTRLDLKIMQSFMQTTAPYALRQWLLTQAKTDASWHSLLPSRALKKYLPIDTQEKQRLDQQALRNMTDYFFERTYLPSLSLQQAADYLSQIKNNGDFQFKTLQLETLKEPIILESLHHRLSFSHCFSAVLHLAKEYGYTHFVMLHEHEKPDPRLLVLQNILLALGYKNAKLLRLHRNWLKEVKKKLTANTVIFTMGDMPSWYGVANEKNQLRLHCFHHQLEIPVFSLASKIASRLNCAHLLLDYPTFDKCQVRINDELPLQCLLEDWIFWPALETLFLAH